MGECVKLKPDHIVAEAMAGKACPGDGAFAFLYPLFRRAPAIVELRRPLGTTGQLGDHETDAGIRFAGMPFRLGDHPTGLVPALGPIAEARVGAPDLLRRSPDRPLQQMGDAVLEHPVGWKAEDVLEIRGLHERVDLRFAKAASARK